ncbi:integrase, catalytic region, zinc finger, CCHC-type containing protein [Tanacetum coccineum]
MLIFSKTPEFLWAEAIATACSIHNRSIVHTRYNNTSYELIHGRKPNVQYFHVFGSLCYPTNDRDDLRKMKPKADIVLDNSAANTLDNENTSSSSSIVIEEDEAPQIVYVITGKVSSWTDLDSEDDLLQKNSIVLKQELAWASHLHYILSTISNSTGVESSNSVRRPKSKNHKSKDSVLKNTNDKRSSAHVRKMSSSVIIDSNKRETMYSNVCQSNASVLNTKTVNVVNDGSYIVCVSCGKDVFLLSHEKCVARYALSRDSKVKRALFITPIAAKSRNLGATSVVVKSRLSVAKTPTATNKVQMIENEAKMVNFGFDSWRGMGCGIIPYATWHSQSGPRGDPTRPLTGPDVDPPLNVVDRWLTGGPAMVDLWFGMSWRLDDWFVRLGGWLEVQIAGSEVGSVTRAYMITSRRPRSS